MHSEFKIGIKEEPVQPLPGPLTFESVKEQQLKPAVSPPPLADCRDIVVSYNAYTGPEQNLTMGLATVKRGRARRAIIAFSLKENIFLRMRWFGSE